MGKMMREEFDHVFRWGNNPVRVKYKGKPCKVLRRGRLNSIVIKFEDGLRMVTSRNAVRKL